MNLIFLQDFLEELKLVVRGSLFQVASLQDCFLQQSEPLATASTGVGSWALFVLSSTQTPKPPSGLGPVTKGWAVHKAVLREVSPEIRLFGQNPGHGIFSLLFFYIFITHMDFEVSSGIMTIIF